MFYGTIVTTLTVIFGQHWFLFAGFLVMNVIDYITEFCKVKFYSKNESNEIGVKGIIKKIWYWVVIGLAFYISFSFSSLGEEIGINLTFVQFFGWFTLGVYLINEVRSILENLVEMDVKVPTFLITGLATAEKLLEAKTKNENRKDERGRK